MKKRLQKGLLLFLLPLFAFTGIHKYYVSVTNVNYSEKDKAIQITSRIFTDDFDDLLILRYDLDGKLGTDKELELATTYITKYFKSKFTVQINGKQVAYSFLGKKYEDDIMVCYIEIPNIDITTVKSIEVRNQLFTDIYEEQQNIVHFKVNGKKKSFVLIKESSKGLLKL